MKSRESGSLTVHFSMIMAVITVFMVILYLAEQVMQAQVRGRQVLNICASSVLAGYDRELYQKYGFFAIENTTLAQKDLDHFLAIDLDPYRSGEWTLTPQGFLTDQAEYEKQMQEFMRVRFPVTLVDQYTDLLKDLKDMDDISGVVDAEISLSEAMEEYSRLFSEFITALEGIDDYGNQEVYYVKGLWDETWSKKSYQNVITDPGEESAQALSSWRERASGFRTVTEEACDLWSQLIQEGERIRPILEELQKEAELEEQRDEIGKILKGLHTGTSQDLAIQKRLETNLKALKEVDEGLDLLLNDPASEEGKKKAKKLLDYQTEIHVEYEIRPMTGSRKSWKKLWKELQNYVTDLSGYVEKNEKISKDRRKKLPSGGETSGSVLDGLSLTELSKVISDDIRDVPIVLLMKAYNIEYVCGMFCNLEEVIKREDQGKSSVSLRGSDKETGFLEAEAEYVLAGKGSDLSNCKTVRLEILGIRMISNLCFLATDPDKRAVIEGMAAIGGILAPGVGDLILKGIIMAVWAGAESFQDYERLIHGGKVPLVKSPEDWHVDLDSLMENMQESIADQEEEEGRGLRYIDHLKILFLFLSNETLERRTQDLIELNLEEMTGFEIPLTSMITAFAAEGSYYDNGRRYELRGEYGYT